MRMIKIKEQNIFLLILLLAILFRIGSYNIVPLFSDTATYARISAEIAEGDYWLTGPNASDKPRRHQRQQQNIRCPPDWLG